MITSDFFKFINSSPTSFHTIHNIRRLLEQNGGSFLDERDTWQLLPGGTYFTIRGGSSIIAFSVPETEARSFRVTASHSDSPTFRLKPDPEMEALSAYTMLNTEPYGGAIFHTWMDRPLSVAGRVIVKKGDLLEPRLVSLDQDLLVIPSLAIHMDREVNKKLELNAQKDLLPLFGDLSARGGLKKMLAKNADCDPDDILGEDLFLYNRQKPVLLGAQKEYICSSRLDDLECVYGTLLGFLNGQKSGPHISLYCVFDNEEVGSTTKQGAASTFLADVLERICLCLGYNKEKYHRMIAAGFLVSADNAHAIHPAAPEKADPVNRPRMNEGIVLKYSARQKYTTDGASAAVFHSICRSANIPYQDFSNRSDIPGGSTLGNISSAQVPFASVDIGLAQLAMHSVCETAGAKDLAWLAQFSKCFFELT